MPRRISDAGLGLIKEFEGLRLDAYRCPAGFWTIGYGHTGPDVFRGKTITEAEADALLREDVRTAEAVVDRSVTVPLSDNAFSALVPFVFNIGATAFAHSTLLRKLNAGDVVGAADEFPKWRLSNGKVLSGLVRRRAAERALFLTPNTEGD